MAGLRVWIDYDEVDPDGSERALKRRITSVALSVGAATATMTAATAWAIATPGGAAVAVAAWAAGITVLCTAAVKSSFMARDIVEQLAHLSRSRKWHKDALAVHLQCDCARVEASKAQTAELSRLRDVEAMRDVLVQRLQETAGRQLAQLDDLEAQIEDPDVLEAVFAVDHLGTLTRRYAENAGVLGDAAPRPESSPPVGLAALLRSATAESLRYHQVALAAGAGAVHGAAAADVVHIIAELLDNATAASDPTAQVELSAQQVAAGLAIEVVDRGQGLSPKQLRQCNAILSHAEQPSSAEHRRIGLYVVAALARLHRIQVSLRASLHGGVHAVAVVPADLVCSTEASETVVAPSASPFGHELDSDSPPHQDDTADLPQVVFSRDLDAEDVVS